jgi:hypothetical protein
MPLGVLQMLKLHGGNKDMTTRELKRLIADEGKVLQNTKTGKTAYCVDVFAENVDLWKEIEDVNTKEDKEE